MTSLQETELSPLKAHSNSEVVDLDDCWKGSFGEFQELPITVISIISSHR